MTGNTFFYTNFLFNVGSLAANSKSTTSDIYEKVLPIYGDKIASDTFNFKNK